MLLLENILGSIALTTTLVGLTPQIYKAYKVKSTQDLSWIMLLNYLVCSLSWIGYGCIQDSAFVVWSNIVGTLTSSVSIIQKYIYDRKVTTNTLMSFSTK